MIWMLREVPLVVLNGLPKQPTRMEIQSLGQKALVRIGSREGIARKAQSGESKN